MIFVISEQTSYSKLNWLFNERKNRFVRKKSFTHMSHIRRLTVKLLNSLIHFQLILAKCWLRKSHYTLVESFWNILSLPTRIVWFKNKIYHHQIHIRSPTSSTTSKLHSRIFSIKGVCSTLQHGKTLNSCMHTNCNFQTTNPLNVVDSLVVCTAFQLTFKCI